MPSNDLDVWSIPPIISDPTLPDVIPPVPNPATGTMRIPLRQGIICQVDMDREWLIQNVNTNEDDVIEFSLHGEVDGTWNKLNTHSLVKAGTTMFFLNRTDIDVLYMAIFPQ